MKKPSFSSRPSPQASHQRTFQAARAPQKKSGGGILLGLFLGLVVGILIAFGVVWYLNKTPLPFMNKYEGATRDTGKGAAPSGTPGAPGANGAPGQQPAAPTAPIALPGKPGEKPGDKPRFDFYGILEGKAPGSSTPTGAQAPAVEPAKPASPPVKEVMFLQVGAFQKAGDADNLKAKLAMMGVEAGVQEIDLPEKGKMHRVRVGPLASSDEMNRVRSHLSQGGIQSTVIKQKAD